MDTRDVVAAMILQGLVQGSPSYRHDTPAAVSKAWELADALLAHKPPAPAGVEGEPLITAKRTRTRAKK